MLLVSLIVIPLVGGILAWAAGSRGFSAGKSDGAAARWISLAALAAELVLALSLWRGGSSVPASGGTWLAEFAVPWVPALGIGLHLAMDGISLLFVLLTALLGMAAVAASWTEIDRNVGFFHFLVLTALAGIIGVFTAFDLFLFAFFWELMLVPIYFLIALWGHERRKAAAVKFFIFTQLSGLVMLVSILALYVIHGRQSGIYSFDFFSLIGTELPAGAAPFILLGFLAAFLVKLPAVPFHTWLADAHTEAPTAGSVILAGLLLKTGGYGLLRFALPLVPGAALALTPLGLTLGVIGILYGAVLAFAQTDLKRLVAYTSISHMGFVLVGIFARNETALLGAIIQMLSHGISTGALFILTGALQERLRTRDLQRLGGLWALVPRLGGAWMVFALASLGLPGMGNFIGEFLVLVGLYRVSVPATVLAALGLVLSTIYAVRMVQRVFFGTSRVGGKIPDLLPREMTIMAVMIALILWLGLYPRPFLDAAQGGLANIGKTSAAAQGGTHDTP